MKILIGQIRQKKGVSLRRLEHISGIPKSTLNEFENNIRSPRIDQLEEIAKALDCKITDLIDSFYK